MADVPPPSRLTPDPAHRPPSRGRHRGYRARARSLARTLAVDVAPLRASRDFRLLFIGQGVSYAGTMITYVAVPYQVYSLTGSSLMVGLTGLAELVPILVMSFVGGALADAVDRRRMVWITEAGLCLATGALLVNAVLPHPRLWLLFMAVAGAAAMDALQRPSLDALVPRVVAREQLASAASLVALRGNVGQLLGPPVAGLLIAVLGLASTFAIDAATFMVSLGTIARMRRVPPPEGAAPMSLASVRAGVAYAMRRRDLLGSYLVDMNAMFFGMPLALFPQIAAGLGGPLALGVLYMGPSAGSLLASATSGWTRSVRRHGRAIALSAGCWGLAIVAFGFAPGLWPAFLALAVAGAADTVSGLFRMTLWNESIPDDMRGRLAGIEMISYSSGPALGNLESGAVGALAGVRASVVSGGILCVVGTAGLCALLPAFWGYRSGGAERERAQDGGTEGA